VKRSGYTARRQLPEAGPPRSEDFKENSVNRIELVEKIAQAHTVSKAEAARILQTVTGAIVASVKKGEPVQLVGFGTFKQVARAARTGFNPQA
jgi:DNA-binding protein HU-beta